jgi:hypothetical protein
MLAHLLSLKVWDSLPNGPLISIVGSAAAADDLEFFRTVGWWIVKITSGGIDNGARPICDEHWVEAEKVREEGIGKAGRRNEGKDIESGMVATFSKALARAVESIADVVCLNLQRGERWTGVKSGKD